MLRKNIWIVAAVCWCVQTCVGQDAPAVVPIAKEPWHHLVFENEYVRVFKVEVAPHAETLYHKHDVDYVFVTLGDSDVDSVRVGEKPVRLLLKDGDTRFTKGGFAHKAVNNSDKPFVNVTVELKKAFDAEMKNCEEPMKCTRDIMLGGSPIGDSTSLFTNGFVTVVRHHLKAGASLTSSYYSARGKDKILFVPLTQAKVNFGGISELLNIGQVYFSGAGELEVNAGDDDVRWVMIRLNLPASHAVDAQPGAAVPHGLY
ncbi:MAG: hypothetical protein JWO13_3785 [Acidobacteriales bacterium]|nr:hypothetical protein [Terriglobales bacterium]